MYRAPLLLKAVDGMSQRDVAEVLGISEDNVEVRLARARVMLQDRFLRASLASRTLEPDDGT